MNRQETSKPQYMVRPTLYIHAENDVEAEMRMQQVRNTLQSALTNTEVVGNILRWMYFDVELEPGSLTLDGWPDSENRIVR